MTSGEPGSTEFEPTTDESLALAETAETRGRFSRNKGKLSLSAFLGGTAVSLATNPLGEIASSVVHEAPWAIGGLAASEGMWIGGAAMMLAGAGKKIGNPFTIRSRWAEITRDIPDSQLVRSGLVVNTTGALGTAGIVAAGAVIALPPETWPGALALASVDATSTVAIRAGLFSVIQDRKQTERLGSNKVTVRHAQAGDIDRLADIDLLLFDKAYGTDKPDKQEVVDMLTQRFNNNPGWMFVAEMNGEVEGFVTAFRTDKPIEKFVSWEDSTADGTLEGRVVPDGDYVYVANMTIKHEAVENGAEEMLLANLFANAIRDGVDYGYFVSRMPYFKRWLQKSMSDETIAGLSDEQKMALATEYSELRRDDNKREDAQLRMYEGFGYRLVRLVANGSKDDASLDFGVVCKADIPPQNQKLKQIKPVRVAMSKALRQIAKNPKLLNKVF
jgi:hypothetical protein